LSTHSWIRLDRSSILLISTRSCQFIHNVIVTSIQHVRINNQIRVSEVRLIGKDGENIGVVSIEEARKKAAEAELDLIEVSPKAQPPVARIADYGKYQYQKEKEARESGKKQKNVDLKAVRVGFNASPHDMELRAKKANELLLSAGRVQIDFILKGRAKYLDRNFIQSRLHVFLALITIPFRKTSEPKKGPRGLTLVLEKES